MKMSNRLWLVAIASVALLTGCERPPVDTVQVGYRGTGMEQVYNPRILQQVAARNQAPQILPAADTEGPLASEIYENVQVLTDLTVGEFTRVMSSMTEWVAGDEQCLYCHVENNLADDSKYQYKVARSMLQMTRDINSNWTSHVGDTGVTCHTCHRGNAVPENVWFTDPGSRKEVMAIGTNAGQNTTDTALGRTTIVNSSLPYDPYSPYLLGAEPIRVNGTTALPSGNRASIKQAEWSYSLMVHMSDALGVNCTYCHNSRAFGEWEQSRPQRTVAWYGIRMARQLNNQYLVPLTGEFPKHRLGPLGDVAKVNCQTCHQGVYKPYFGGYGAAEYPELKIRAKAAEEAVSVAQTEAAPAPQS
jgi:photosynthetic reaction center cytochrome c subunit